jgi:hypothetical protein
MKLWAGSIVFVTIVFAVLFRFEFSGSGVIRSDRWTGKTELECEVDGRTGWHTEAECNGKLN